MIVQTAAVVSAAVLAAGAMALATAPVEPAARRGDRLATVSAPAPHAVTVEWRSVAGSTLVRVPASARD
jgi:hypothetical protein